MSVCLEGEIASVIYFQVALPSQAVSVSVSRSRIAIPLSPLGVLVAPDAVSSVRIQPEHSHLPIFWSLNKSLSGDRVRLFLLYCLVTVLSDLPIPSLVVHFRRLWTLNMCCQE